MSRILLNYVLNRGIAKPFQPHPPSTVGRGKLPKGNPALRIFSQKGKEY